MSNHNRKLRPAGVPASGLSIFEPIYLGIDEDRARVEIELIYRNILLGGEPGSGKSVALNNIVAHAALSADCGLWLMDGKQVELGLWRTVADVFVGNDITHALTALDALQAEMDSRYDYLADQRRRKITPADPYRVIVLVVDEVAYFSATVGDKTQRETFAMGLRDLVARGRAAGIIVVAATQRPSADIIPTSLRDLFGYRQAFRCTTEISSDIILGYGWAKAGYGANTIAPEDRGIGYLLAEGGIPRRMKAAYLSDSHIYALVDHARRIRAARGAEAG
jgi:S-DNA-T family DNA segregation ATPase FtsK/SpoIIIE